MQRVQKALAAVPMARIDQRPASRPSCERLRAKLRSTATRPTRCRPRIRSTACRTCRRGNAARSRGTCWPRTTGTCTRCCCARLRPAPRCACAAPVLRGGAGLGLTGPDGLRPAARDRRRSAPLRRAMMPAAASSLSSSSDFSGAHGPGPRARRSRARAARLPAACARPRGPSGSATASSACASPRARRCPRCR